MLNSSAEIHKIELLDQINQISQKIVEYDTLQNRLKSAFKNKLEYIDLIVNTIDNSALNNARDVVNDNIDTNQSNNHSYRTDQLMDPVFIATCFSWPMSSP